MIDETAPVSLLIVDMDNTLYDWVGYFVPAMNSMVAKASLLLDVPEAELRRQLAEVHRHHGNTEHPFALLETHAVRHKYGHSRTDAYGALREAFDAFDAEKTRRLALYPGVAETLGEIRSTGCIIVGHTEAISVSIQSRARFLKLERYLSCIYAPAPRISAHPLQRRNARYLEVRAVDEIRKPNPRIIDAILNDFKISRQEALYVGDSLEKDMAMALNAGIRAAWARYGLRHDPNYWTALLEISHWRPVKPDPASAREKCTFSPSQILDSFQQLLGNYRFTKPSFEPA